ncbi:unnamed protein product [Durusdinium trenchii]|uniref:Uncharacterized protein n=1 Tax=Durusdinium trenchii TaxID=1381693 RepID=A0ABP0S2U1_9DINO
MKRQKNQAKKEEKKAAKSQEKPQSALLMLGIRLVACLLVCGFGLIAGASDSFHSEVERKTSIFLRLPIFFVTQGLLNDLFLGLGLQLARRICGDPGDLPWDPLKEEVIHHDSRITWPAIELPKELQPYKSRVGQPFFLNHVTGRQRCKDACMRCGMGVGALLGVWFMCVSIWAKNRSSLGFTLDMPFFSEASMGFAVGVFIVAFMFAIELLNGWVIFIQFFEVFDQSENFWICIFWDVVFHLPLNTEGTSCARLVAVARCGLLPAFSDARICDGHGAGVCCLRCDALAIARWHEALEHAELVCGWPCWRSQCALDERSPRLRLGLAFRLEHFHGQCLWAQHQRHPNLRTAHGQLCDLSACVFGIGLWATFISVVPHPQKENYHGGVFGPEGGVISPAAYLLGRLVLIYGFPDTSVTGPQLLAL